MATLSSIVHESAAGNLLPQLLAVEAPAGPARHRWLGNYLKDAADSGARTFCVTCDFKLAGVWAGVKQLFSVILSEMQTDCPDLLERHAVELVQVLPQLRRSLTVRSPSLTDLASDDEKVRNYAADRAFRALQGLIDLVDSWKSANCPGTAWLIACDDYDKAGMISSRFFQELLRRKGGRLHIRLLVGVGPGKGNEVQALFRVPTAETITVEVADEASEAIDPDAAAQAADEIETRVGNDRIEKQDNLSDLIRLWKLAGRPDKVMRWKYFGLTFYCNLGYYADALRYGEGLLPLAVEHAPEDVRLQWWIIIKMIHGYTGVANARAALEIAEGVALKMVPKVSPVWHSQLLYLTAMLYARIQQPRDFAKGEELLDEAFALLQTADIPEGDRCFPMVFNRNGVAMIRSFQSRNAEAMELCRAGIAELDAHLGADKHRLHRSILHYNIAQVCAATGSLGKAIEYLSAAMDMDPNYSEYYNERGNIFLRLGRLKEALDDYLKAIDLSPPYFEVWTNLGQCYRRMGVMTEAVECYSRALDLNPDHLLALLGRAQAHEEANKQARQQ
jgi:tetratricopeptide (TPR) repeat protein